MNTEDIQQNLKRDYIKDPLQKGEIPLYEDLYYLYIICNMTYEEVSQYLGNIKKYNAKRFLKNAKIIKPQELKVQCIKRKTKEKYGVESYSKTPEYKARAKQTSLEKYGVDNPNKCREIREKIEQTNLQRYGYKNASKSERVKQKVKQTCLEKYGVEAFTQANEFKEKAKQTCLERYGVEYASRSEEFQEKVKQKSLEKYGVGHHLQAEEVKQKRVHTCLEKYGTTNVSTRHITPEVLTLINDKQALWEYINTFEVKDYRYIAETLGISYDGLEKKLCDFDLWDKLPHGITRAELELQELYPNFKKTRQAIPPYEIDLYDDDKKIGIEYNGIYWHSEKFKESDYHQEKSLLAQSKGIRLYHIFENEWRDERKKMIILSQINNFLGMNYSKIGARQCVLKEISANDCNEFLQQNHLQGQDQSSIRYGLFYQDKLVSVMTFCRPRFNQNYEWELSRFCNICNTTVRGAASKLFKHFLKTYSPKNIISYSNFAKTTGKLYENLGFKQIHLAKPNYVWINGLEVLSRYQCQKHRLEDFKDLGSTEVEIMHNRGFLRMYDCGNVVWSYVADF